MKKSKKVLAIFLVLITVFYMLSVTASAENEENYDMVIVEAKAVTLDKENSQKVLRIELTMGMDDETKSFVYDTADSEAEIMISEFSYAYRRAVIDAVSGHDVSDETIKKLCNESEIAKAKAVSFTDNVLTVDIYSIDGNHGAEMVEVDITGFDDFDSKAFVFKFPEKMFSNSETGEESGEIYIRADMDGLETVTVEAPLLVRAYFGDEAVFSLTVLLVLPFLPVSALIFAVRYQRVCEIYGFDIFSEIKSMLNIIITEIKQNI